MEMIPQYLNKYFDKWTKVDEFNDQIKVGEKTIFLSGVAWKDIKDRIVTGSAASEHYTPEDRAYFELFERIIAIEGQKETQFPLYDEKKSFLGIVPKEFVFPNQPNDYHYSISNGMAFHTDPDQAMQKAKYELIERDRILRSWYGETKPLRIRLDQKYTDKSKALSSFYHIEAFHFLPSSKDELASQFYTVGIFAFPVKEEFPLVYGLGCSNKIEDSIEHSWSECLQRMGFLFGEEKKETLSDFSPTALYHQDYYLTKVGENKIYNWLTKGNNSKIRFPKSRIDQIKFANITPSEMKDSQIVVYRAIENNHIPLIFGKNYSILDQQIPFELQIHPIV